MAPVRTIQSSSIRGRAESVVDGYGHTPLHRCITA